jgi:WD40 repeat protein
MPSIERQVLYNSNSLNPLPLTSLSVAQKTQKIACGTMDARVIIVDGRSGRAQRAIVGHEGLISCVAFVGDGRQLLSSSWDNTTRLWKCGKEAVCRAVLTHRSEAKVIAVDNEAGRAVAGARDGEVKVFSVSTLKCLRNLQAHRADISGVALDEKQKKLITTSWDGNCRVWNTEDYSMLDQIVSCKQRIRSFAASPGLDSIFLGLHDGSILSIRTDEPDDRVELRGHTDVVSSLALSPSGAYLMSGSWDRSIRFWSLAKSREAAQIKLSAGVTQASWGADDLRAYSTDFSGTLTAWTLDI